MKISIHAPTRGATQYADMFVYIIQFQSTLLQEERLAMLPQIISSIVFQSTLLQEERLDSRKNVSKTVYISIHAPTRGATLYGFYCSTGGISISIHAPTRGATIHPLAYLIRGILFQSTLLQEERHYFSYHSTDKGNISIHAPTRGATAKMHNYPYTYL